MKDWKVWGLLIGLFLLVKMCGGCNGCGGEDYSWLNGTWVCNMQYGSIIVEIDGNHIQENYGGDIYTGTYSIRDNEIHPNTNSHVVYPLDISSQRICDGRGGYFRKQ